MSSSSYSGPARPWSAASSRPLAPSSHRHQATLVSRSIHQECLDGEALVQFALDATIAIRKECNFLAGETRPKALYSILASLLSDVESRLKRIDTPASSRTFKLLLALERLSKYPENVGEPTTPNKQSSYPRLLLVLNGNSERARNCIKSLAGDRAKKIDRERFQTTLKRFAAVKIEDTKPQVGLSEFMKSEGKPVSIDETTQCLQKLYSSLRQLCRCVAAVNGSSFKTNVALNSMAPPTQADDGLAASMFILHEHLSGDESSEEWKEACIRVFLERYDMMKSKIPHKTPRFASSGIEVLDFCSLVRSKDLGCLKLSASKDGLLNGGRERSRSKICLRSPSVPLARVLASPGLKKHMIRKTLLSYLLAKAVWRFYESDWMADHWTTHKVHLMRHRAEGFDATNFLDYQPFLSTEFRDSETTTASASTRSHPLQEAQVALGQTHIYPKILALGIMLLEIDMEEGLESRLLGNFLDLDGQVRMNASHIAAGDFIESDEWQARTRSDTLGPIKEAIEICVKPDTGKLGSNPMQIRDTLYSYIIVPLGGLFKVMTGKSAESFDPGPIHIKSIKVEEHASGLGTTPRSSHSAAKPFNNNMKSRPSPTSQAFPSQLHGRASHSRATTGTATRNHGTSCSKESGHDMTCVQAHLGSVKQQNDSALLAASPNIKDSFSWLEKFDRAKQQLLQARNCTHPSAATKIAVLDTGCDGEDYFFSGPGEEHGEELADRWLDCLEEADEPVDEDPKKHGTALTALLLRLAPGANIYIARVAKNSKGLSEAKDVIAQAIAQVVKKWDVDIITMSFGFERKIPQIRSAIVEAERTKNDKIVFFAAANNDGLNMPEMFPAFDGSVISVRGTRPDGSFEPLYNPNTWPHKAAPHFGTLALDVPCGWVDDRLTKSGCSVATPILAAIAALIITYVKVTFPDDHQYQDRIRSRDGILSVFRAMSADQKGERLYLTPWQLFENNRSPSNLIAYALDMVPDAE